MFRKHPFRTALVMALVAGAFAVLQMASTPLRVTAANAAVQDDECAEKVLGFSKDACAGRIGDGVGTIAFCPDGSQTLCVKGAKWTFPLKRNPQGCGDCDGVLGRCDETGVRKDGKMEAETSFKLDLDKGCRFRGCWESRWTYRTEDGTIFAGTAFGTFGTGSHRPFSCSQNDARSCERCYDVEFIPLSPDFGIWRVGVEGSFMGDALSPVDPPRERLCFTISGDLIAFGTCDGPFDPNSFEYYGTADGVLLQRCQ